MIDGVVFFVATTDLGRLRKMHDPNLSHAESQPPAISYISTRDPKFTTPEGIHVGSTLREVYWAGGGKAEVYWAGGEAIEDTGGDWIAPLPSGWKCKLAWSSPRKAASSPDQSTWEEELLHSALSIPQTEDDKPDPYTRVVELCHW